MSLDSIPEANCNRVLPEALTLYSAEGGYMKIRYISGKTITNKNKGISHHS